MTLLKTLLSTSAILLILSGCASLQQQQERLAPSLLGQPVSSLTALYGRPLVMGNLRAYRVSEGVSVGSTSVSAPVSGYVGNAPFTGTVRVPGESYVTQAYCTIQVAVDDAGLIRSVQLRGDAKVCKGSLGA